METLAVILPAYNAERTLGRALESLLAQTYQALEIWVVNDGSTDGTGAIAEDYARRDGRIHVLHEVNQRPYRARLNALRRIKAPFFTFLDADDWIEPEAYAQALGLMETHALDMVMFEMAGMALPSAEAYELFVTPEAVREQVIHQMLARCFPIPYLCNKVYRNVYDFTALPSWNLHSFDDIVLNYYLFRSLQRVGYLHQPFYHYHISSSSSVCGISQQKVDDLKLAQRLRYHLLIEDYGYTSEDPCHKEWLIRTARVFMVLIATAPRLTFAERRGLLQQIFELPRLEEALASSRGASVCLLRLSRAFPRLTFFFLRPLRALWRHLPLRIRLKN